MHFGAVLSGTIERDPAVGANPTLVIIRYEGHLGVGTGATLSW